MSATAGRYTRIGDKKGPLVIRGAEKKMEEDSSFTYVPMYRIAGPLSDVESWLQENHPEESKDALKGSYSKATLKNKVIREAFEREVVDANEEREASLASKNEIRKVNLMVLVKLLKLYESQKKTEERPVSDAPKSTKQTLKERVAALSSEKKVLDITNMKAKGTDSKKMTFKDGSSKRRLSQDTKDPLYSVVYNPTQTQSVDGVKHFLTQYGGFKDSQIEKLVSAVSEGSIINVSRGKSPTRSMISPRRAKKRQQAAEEDLGDLLEEM